MSDATVEAEHSRLLQELLKDRSLSDFFSSTWQRKPEIFRFLPQVSIEFDSPKGATGDGRWSHERMNVSPLHEMVQQRWHVLRDLIYRAERLQPTLPQQEPPLIFRELELQSREDVEELYGSSLCSPYLNGCSIVVNHGDLLSPWIAAVCLDLQKSFPHAYANCYLTPPHSQAVPPHADDRDVFVIQLVGSKDWKVYATLPVPYPYPQEQVGKQGLAVPKEVLDGPVSISTTLRSGDVLYMPRGFVHEARCSNSLSFHVTIALATHDWSLAGIMSIATEAILTRTVEFRKSILPVSSADEMQALQRQVDSAMQLFQEEITAEKILENLKSRLEMHNQRAYLGRMASINEAGLPRQLSINTASQPLIGSAAAALLSFDSRIRAATPEERASVASTSSVSHGLHVREEIADSIMGIIARLKADLSLICSVLDLRTLMPSENALVCDLSLLSLATRAVELGAFCLVPQ